MRAITKFLAGGVAIAALAGAAPAAAQFFPGMGYPGYGSPGYGYPGMGSPGYGYGYGYGNVPGGSRIAVSQCTAAVQQRLGGYGYGYGYGGGGGRVVNVNSVEIRTNGGYKVRGVAAAGGYAYGGAAVPFTCRTDPRGFVTDVQVNNGYYGQGYYNQNYANPYSVYGYQRY